MAYGIRQGFASSLLVVLLTACAGQQIRGNQALSAKHYVEQSPNHECKGSACGPMALMSTWTLETPAAVGEVGACLGSGCGPMAAEAQWLLEETSRQCLGSACGPEMRPTHWQVQYVRFAADQPGTRRF